MHLVDFQPPHSLSVCLSICLSLCLSLSLSPSLIIIAVVLCTQDILWKGGMEKSVCLAMPLLCLQYLLFVNWFLLGTEIVAYNTFHTFCFSFFVDPGPKWCVLSHCQRIYSVLSATIFMLSLSPNFAGVLFCDVYIHMYIYVHIGVYGVQPTIS